MLAGDRRAPGRAGPGPSRAAAGRRARGARASRSSPCVGSSARISTALGDALFLADEVEAPVDPVRAVDVGVAGRAEHRRVPLGAAAVAVARRVLAGRRPRPRRSRPPTPSTSSVAPISSGATSWTLRAKIHAAQRRRFDVVADEAPGRNARAATVPTMRQDPARDDREAEARQRGDGAGLDVAERRRARDLRELDPGHAAAHRGRGRVQEDRRCAGWR